MTLVCFVPLDSSVYLSLRVRGGWMSERWNWWINWWVTEKERMKWIIEWIDPIDSAHSVTSQPLSMYFCLSVCLSVSACISLYLSIRLSVLPPVRLVFIVTPACTSHGTLRSHFFKKRPTRMYYNTHSVMGDGTSAALQLAASAAIHAST